MKKLALVSVLLVSLFVFNSCETEDDAITGINNLPKTNVLARIEPEKVQPDGDSETDTDTSDDEDEGI